MTRMVAVAVSPEWAETSVTVAHPTSTTSATPVVASAPAPSPVAPTMSLVVSRPPVSASASPTSRDRTATCTSFVSLTGILF